MHPSAIIALAALLAAAPAAAEEAAPEPTPHYAQWTMENLAISTPLDGLTGDPKAGERWARDTHKGNCLACHALPIEGEAFPGDLGPPLTGIAARMTPGQIRLRVVDERKINPLTVMPGYYRHPGEMNRVADDYYGKTMLTAQEVEDIVAYLATLKQVAP